MKTSIKLIILTTLLPIFANAQTILPDTFMRGTKIIFQDNFAKQKTTDLPADWTTNGEAKVDTTHLAPGKWLKILKGQGITCNAKPISLPDSYTIEYEVIPQKASSRNGDDGYGFSIISTPKPENLTYGFSRPGDASINFDFGGYNYFSTFYDDGMLPLKGSTTGLKTLPKQVADQLYKMEIRVEKTRITVWRDGIKVFDLPEAMDLNYKYNMLRFENGTPMVRNFRVMGL